MFDWDLTDCDQGNIDTKMMVFLWFKEGVTPMVRKKVQLDLQRCSAGRPLPFNRESTCEGHSRACVASRNDHWNKAPGTFFIGVMR